jgi:holo-[acyl-carrier protein] synthase
MMILKSGIDLVEIRRLEDIQPAIRQRFLNRVFTDNELAEVGNSAASLAGRFAAKEAVAKALGCGIGPVSWKEIEVLRGEAGQPELKLSGNAINIALQLGLEQWSISISHTAGQAVAVAVALGPGKPK